MEWQRRSMMKQVVFVMLTANVQKRKRVREMQITLSLSVNVIKTRMLGHNV